MKEWLLKYWLEALFGVIVVGLSVACRKLGTRVSNQKALRNGTQALLRNEIIQEHDKYIARKYIPVYGMENVLSMYDAYHKLGGNGTITKIVDELRDLPSNPCEANT